MTQDSRRLVVSCLASQTSRAAGRPAAPGDAHGAPEHLKGKENISGEETNM